MAKAINVDENAGHRRELRALRDLQASEGWKLFAPKLAENLQARIDGLSARGVTPERRAENVEGYHDAAELAGWLDKRIAKLTDLIRQHDQQ